MLQRLEADLERLSKQGDVLFFSMMQQVYGKDDFVKELSNIIGEDVSESICNLPNFNKDYEIWYSEALPAVREILPDRLKDFVSLYEAPEGRKEINGSTYVLQDYFRDIHVTHGAMLLVGPKVALPLFFKQVSILKSAKARLRSSLGSIRTLLQADVFESELDAAKELLAKGFTRAAGAIAGVVLEGHLRSVGDRHGIKVQKKNPGIGILSEALRAHGVIDVPQWRHVGLLADYRNLCDHSKGTEPSAAQVSSLISGTESVLQTIS